jgi:hypothetical protein
MPQIDSHATLIRGRIAISCEVVVTIKDDLAGGTRLRERRSQPLGTNRQWSDWFNSANGLPFANGPTESANSARINIVDDFEHEARMLKLEIRVVRSRSNEQTLRCNRLQIFPAQRETSGKTRAGFEVRTILMPIT